MIKMISNKCLTSFILMICTTSTFAIVNNELQAVTAEEVTEIMQAAKSGNKDAQYNLGLFYQNGIRVDKDINQALQWYTKAANQNDAGAYLSMGILYYNDEFKIKDIHKAFVNIQKAAELGETLAQSHLCMLYDEGKGVEKNPNLALYWCLKAAVQGDATAQKEASRLILAQQQSDEYPKAIEWLKYYAQLGDAYAQFNLGTAYAKGLGVEVDLNRAIELWQLAANKNVPEAYFSLGSSYFYGLGVQQDIQQAQYYYLKAAELDVSEGMVGFALIVQEQSDRQPKGLYLAEEWLKKAVKLNNIKAMYNLASLYEAHPKVFASRNNEIIPLLEKAADLGSIEAMKGLGLLYENKKEDSQQSVKAQYWYQKAAEATASAFKE